MEKYVWLDQCSTFYSVNLKTLSLNLNYNFHAFSWFVIKILKVVIAFEEFVLVHDQELQEDQKSL